MVRAFARALVVFPGGFGTLDELSEIRTLSQTGKLTHKMPVVLYGKGYWNEVINFDAMLRHGMIAGEDLALFQYADDPVTALRLITEGLMPGPEGDTPAFAHSRARPA